MTMRFLKQLGKKNEEAVCLTSIKFQNIFSRLQISKVMAIKCAT